MPDTFPNPSSRLAVANDMRATPRHVTSRRDAIRHTSSDATRRKRVASTLNNANDVTTQRNDVQPVCQGQSDADDVVPLVPVAQFRR
jgi:hypothetical protein